MKPASLETVFELSPMQQGVLFHTLYAPGSSVYVNQSVIALEGAVDAAAMSSAWERLIARHQVLRCSLFWEGLARPVQAVHRQVSFAVGQHDWRGRDDAGADASLATLLADDRARPFDFRRPPQMRVTLIRTGESGWTMVWTRHHILLDGWSQAQLLAELFWLYDAYRVAPDGLFDETPYIGTAEPFERYITWLQSSKPVDPERFWRSHLIGVHGPTPLGLHRDTGQDPVQREIVRELPADLSAALEAVAHGSGVTLASLYQAAWALVIAARADRPTVVFGSTVSGRPAAVAGIERMVGLFINTLPVRAELGAAPDVLSLARALQEQHARLAEYQHTPLADIQRWALGASAERLFDSVVVVGNYPMPFSSDQGASSLRVTSIRTHVENSLPITLRVMPGSPTRVGLLHDEVRIARDGAAALLDDTLDVVSMAASPDATVAGCLTRLRDAARTRTGAVMAAEAGRLRGARRQPATRGRT